MTLSYLRRVQIVEFSEFLTSDACFSQHGDGIRPVQDAGSIGELHWFTEVLKSHLHEQRDTHTQKDMEKMLLLLLCVCV